MIAVPNKTKFTVTDHTGKKIRVRGRKFSLGGKDFTIDVWHSFKVDRTQQRYIQKLLEKNNRGIRLDIGCGENKQAGFVGMDRRKLDTVDIVHDCEVFPYPFPDESCSVILMSHIIEHLDPKLMIDLFNELWRIMKPEGQLWLSLPYGVSYGFQQDPTHKNACNEATWTYYDPDYFLYTVYRPLPWKVERCNFFHEGNMEAILSKRPLSYVGQFSKKVEVKK